MIVYPTNWKKDYSDFAKSDFDVRIIIDKLAEVISRLEVDHLAYSGGIDSTIILHIMSNFIGINNVHTYTIASRSDHPDIQFARKGSELYNSIYHEFIVTPTKADSDKHMGDNAVRQLFEHIVGFTNQIIGGDGIDEFMCGYYEHTSESMRIYEFYLGKLYVDHLVPLDYNSKDIEVYLPYLDDSLVNIYRGIPLADKVNGTNRKLIMIRIAKELGIPDEFIYRNKYGFCDAFIEKNK